MGELSGKGRRSMDRRKIRVILDALLAAVLVVGMCGALAGCGSGQVKAEAERLDETAEAEDVSDGAVGDDGQQPGDVSGAEAGGDMSDADDGQESGNISGEGEDSENAVNAEDAEGGNGFAQGNENGAEEAVSPFAGIAFPLLQGISRIIIVSFTRRWGRLPGWRIPGGCRCWKGRAWNFAGMLPIRGAR